jgi:hypothetical protein
MYVKRIVLEVVVEKLFMEGRQNLKRHPAISGSRDQRRVILAWQSKLEASFRRTTESVFFWWMTVTGSR